jgi:hypothetical protein
MIETLHVIMMVGAALNLCCVLGNRRSRSGLTVVSTVLMLTAMTDATFHIFGIAPLLWTVLLIIWAMVCAGLLRRRAGAAAAAAAGQAAGSGHPFGALHLHHLLGLLVMAGQLAMHAPIAAISQSTTSAGHAHSASVLMIVAGVQGVSFVVWSVVLVLSVRRTVIERGNLMSMSAMTAAMGIMPFA